jgi:hypothetical protein
VYIRGDENFIYASEVDSGLTSLRVDVAGNMNFIDSIDIWGADSMWGGMWEYSPSFVYPNKAGSPQGLLIDKTESVKRSTRITNIDKAVPGSYAWGHVFGAPLNSKYKFCAFGPEFAVGTDGSWLFGGWHYTCKQAWDDAQMVRLALGCEDEFGNPKPADIEMPAECMLDVQMPYVNAGEPLTPYMQAGSKEKKMHLNACVPCESWNETTATFTRNVGLFFVPAPPIGADSLGGTGDSCDLPIAIADNYRLRYEKTTFEVRPLKDFPATLDAVDCDDSSIKDLYRHQHWVITPKEKRTAVKMIYSGAFGDSVHADIFSDHGSGVFHTGMAVTDVVNCNHRTQEKWEITRPFFYEIEDTCNILDVMPEGSNFWLHTNSPLVEGTNNGKTYILYKPQTRLGPFPVDTKVVVDYYKESEYIAQSNWMCLKDYFMLIMPPRVDRSFTPHRLQSFHGAGHVFTHVSARKREHIQTRKPYWFMNWMSEYHCVYDEAFNGSRIADLYFQIDDAQFEFNYGLCNILTGPSS